MIYIKVTVTTNKQGVEELTARLMEMGITGIEIYDPDEIKDILDKKHEYDWDYVDEKAISSQGSEHKIIVYLESGEEGERDASSIEELVNAMKIAAEYGSEGGSQFGALEFKQEIQDDSDWKDKWKEYFKPAHVTDRIVICPTWEQYEAKDDEVIIHIDPGMAFGTGTHETTSACLEMMEKRITELQSVDEANDAQQNDSGSLQCSADCSTGSCRIRVLDVGCGSGILSIGAALLGAPDVLGIDIDDEAIRVSKENVELNGCSDSVTIQKGDLTKGVDFKADIVCANLAADLVIAFAEDVRRHMLPGGLYISSGIIDDRRQEVLDALEAKGFEIVDIIDKGEWTTIGAR